MVLIPYYLGLMATWAAIFTGVPLWGIGLIIVVSLLACAVTDEATN
jgi:hypothetical protein